MKTELKLKKQEVRKELKKLYPNIKFSIRSEYRKVSIINVEYSCSEIYSPVIERKLKKFETVTSILGEKVKELWGDTLYKGIVIYVNNKKNSEIVDRKIKEMDFTRDLTEEEKLDPIKVEVKRNHELYF